MKFIKSILFFFIQISCFAQSASVSFTMQEAAYIKVAPDNSVFDLVVSSPTVAGEAVMIPASNSTKWINFTSAVVPLATRTISVRITSGDVPSGMALKLSISSANGGAGVLGNNLSSVNLSTNPQTIISNIGGAYTGQGSGYGYNLGFELVISDYSLLRAGNTNISVTFTII